LYIVKENYDYQKKWYHNKALADIIFNYYQELRLVLKYTKVKYRILTSCPYCGILFITSSSNKGRKDILCPFGCRFCHKKNNAAIRSKKYRQTKEGKMKKKKLNQKRYLNNIEPETKNISGENDPNEETFSEYMGFITNLFSKSCNQDQTNQTGNSTNQKKIKNRDSSP
jgi:hypothetical protein